MGAGRGRYWNHINVAAGVFIILNIRHRGGKDIQITKMAEVNAHA